MMHSGGTTARSRTWATAAPQFARIHRLFPDSGDYTADDVPGKYQGGSFVTAAPIWDTGKDD
jgi:hypothetical protein